MKIHFIGIGGVSMSAIARIMKSEGHTVSGSDLNAVKIEGVTTYLGHSANNIKNPDMVVYTAAIARSNVELVRARELGVNTIERSVLLGNLSARYRECVAVSGCHGKTTVSGMLSAITLKKNPTIHIGGELDLIDGNVRVGGKDLFITEACEYVRSFLTLSPTVGIILNIAPDHLDYYKDIDDIISAYREFVHKIRCGGVLVINGEDQNCQKIIADCEKKCNIITFGFCKDLDYSADDVTFEDGCVSFNLIEKGTRRQRVRLRVRGMHNAVNALSAIAAAKYLGVSTEEAIEGLEKFKGVGRRFEEKSELSGARVFVDYAHHPEEISASIRIAKTMSKRVVVVFQPHTYTRTKLLLEDFADALIAADDVLLADVYSAREDPSQGVKTESLTALLQSRGKNVLNPHSFQGLAEAVKSTVKKDDIILIMGAGDINRLVEYF